MIPAIKQFQPHQLIILFNQLGDTYQCGEKTGGRPARIQAWFFHPAENKSHEAAWSLVAFAVSPVRPSVKI